MAEDNSQLSIQALQQRLRAVQAIQRTVLAIFALIILAWIVLGYWRDNLPVFITTVTMAVATGAATSIGPRSLRAQIKKRQSAATPPVA